MLGLSRVDKSVLQACLYHFWCGKRGHAHDFRLFEQGGETEVRGSCTFSGNGERDPSHNTGLRATSRHSSRVVPHEAYPWHRLPTACPVSTYNEKETHSARLRVGVQGTKIAPWLVLHTLRSEGGGLRL
jgi:hypothetical protein